MPTKLDFAHVTDRPVRDVLERPIERLRRKHLAIALDRTAKHFDRDWDNPAIPGPTLAARADAFVKAEDDFRAGRLKASRKRLRAFWNV